MGPVYAGARGSNLLSGQFPHKNLAGNPCGTTLRGAKAPIPKESQGRDLEVALETKRGKSGIA